MKRRTSCTVSSSCPTPRWESVSHCKRDQHRLGGGQGRDRHHAERRRAVEQDPVVVARQVLERRAQHVLATGARQQVGLGPRQLDRRRQQVDAVLGLRGSPPTGAAPWSARGGSRARGPRGRCPARTSGRPAGRGRPAAPTRPARPGRHRSRPPTSSWPRRPSGWRPPTRRGAQTQVWWTSPPIMPRPLPARAYARVGWCGMSPDGSSPPPRPGHRPDVGTWPALRDRLARRGYDLVLVARDEARLTGGRRRARHGVRRRLRGAGRRPRRPRPAGGGRGPARRPVHPGRPAGQQRRVRAQAEVPATTPSSRSRRISTCS